MISFNLNNQHVSFDGDSETSLLDFLRNEKGIVSVKDACSGKATCGACLVEIDEKPVLSCTISMKSLENSSVFTLDGIDENIRKIIVDSFVEKGAVQCGYCTPGFIMRTRLLLLENPNPTLAEIRKAIRPHLCRCTGYKKIEQAIDLSAKKLSNKNLDISMTENPEIGKNYKKYKAFETAIATRLFVDDMKIDGMLHAALRFSDHPKARILNIDISEAIKLEGVVRIFTSKDIPGKRKSGLIFDDWWLMIGEDEITCCISDVLAGIVATSREIARKAAALIKIDYEILKPVSDAISALKKDAPQVHENRSNILDICSIERGNPLKEYENSAYKFSGTFNTQRIEHAFLEIESAIGMCENEILHIYSQGQGVYEDRRQIAAILGITEENVRVSQVECGGGFGGKEDLTVQAHVALFSYLLKKPVKLTLSRSESIRMHPKRHPVSMDISLSCDTKGNLTSLILKAVGDSGAYASVGNKVMERLAGHATGGYFVPDIKVESLTVYTNNIPSGAMRGFGVNQVTFALESCIDELCKQGNFDRWKFRWENALVDGLLTSTGQKVKDAGIRKCLEALKTSFYSNKFVGIACGIKNSGIGNGMIDFSDVIVEIVNENKILIHHGWTEMGQGIHTIAIQTLCSITGINPQIVEVFTDTKSNVITGMTTASRGSVLLGNAVIDAAGKIKEDLKNYSLAELSGKSYKGHCECNWTTKPGIESEEIITHYSYGYAAQLCILDEKGKIEKIVAAHDAGKIINSTLFEGQIEGAVHMGLGFAISENLPMRDGYLVKSELKNCGILRADETPEIEVIGIEVNDSFGPFGAKGVGEIGGVPTAAAVANALCVYDGNRRVSLPMGKDCLKKY